MHKMNYEFSGDFYHLSECVYGIFKEGIEVWN